MKKPSDRRVLPARKEPYYHQLSKYLYVGYFKSPISNVESWKARKYDGKKYHYHIISVEVEQDDKDEDDYGMTFEEAVRAAYLWSDRDNPVNRTVEQVLGAHVTDLEKRKPHTAAAERAALIFRRCPARVTRLQFAELKAVDVAEVQDSLIARGIKPQSVNREMSQYRAAFNFGFGKQMCESDSAWSPKRVADLELDDDDSGRRETYLTLDQRRHLFAAMKPDLRLFSQGLEMTGCRPGELAAATVADLKNDRLRFKTRKGAKARLRERWVELDKARLAFFKGQATGKLPAALLFTRNDGSGWMPSHRRGYWVDPFVKAVKRAWPNENNTFTGAERDQITAYVIRHCSITDMIRSGMPIDLVADTCGTSPLMIHKSYRQEIPNSARGYLANVSVSST